MPGSIYPTSIPSFHPLSPIFEAELPGGRFWESSNYNHVIFNSHAELYLPHFQSPVLPRSPLHFPHPSSQTMPAHS